MNIEKLTFRAAQLILIIFISFTFTSCELFDEATDPGLSDSEIIQGLKEALSVGLDNSVTSASSVDGYLKNEAIKILLPAEVQELQTKINTESVAGIPLSTIYNVYVDLENDGNDLFDELIDAMNKGAEDAADKALPIFGDAITSMTFQDARGILNGGDRSATDFFERETKTDLVTAFSPDVRTALEGAGAIQVFETISGFLNYEYDPTGLGFISISPNDVLDINLPSNIEEYATDKAVDGMFYLVGEEEKKIREDPFAWGSNIIERVFGSIL